MQVSARVLPATASWSALREADAALQELSRRPLHGARVRRSGLLRSTTELQAVGGRPLLVVTIQHPRN
jgi:hypothetical protein